MSFERLEAALEQVDEATARWLRQGLQRWRDGENLDRALELTGQRAESRRNAALRLAAERVDPKGQHSTWWRAQRLAYRIQQFERINWPKCRNDPDKRYPEASTEHALLTAFRVHPRIPRSARQIHTIIK